MSRPSFAKREREQAKKDKAAAKRDRRQRLADAQEADRDAATATATADDLSTADVLQMIEDVHRSHADGEMSDDDFEATKADLLGRLQVD